MRARKQGPLEPFDGYLQSILKLANLLKRPISDEELVQMMQRGLKPRLREELMFGTIHVFNEIRARPMPTNNSMGRRIASLDQEGDYWAFFIFCMCIYPPGITTEYI